MTQQNKNIYYKCALFQHKIIERKMHINVSILFRANKVILSLHRAF